MLSLIRFVEHLKIILFLQIWYEENTIIMKYIIFIITGLLINKKKFVYMVILSFKMFIVKSNMYICLIFIPSLKHFQLVDSEWSLMLLTNLFYGHSTNSTPQTLHSPIISCVGPTTFLKKLNTSLWF